MPQFIADKDYYADADGKLVAADDPNATTLVAREGTAVDPVAIQRYGLDSLTAAPQPYDAIADHEAKHGGETQAEADARRTAMLKGQPDPDGPAVEGERDDVKATDAAPATKAVTKAPANKSRE